MIRQSSDRTPSRKGARKDQKRSSVNTAETAEIAAEISNDGDELDPADFFDAEDLEIASRR